MKKHDGLKIPQARTLAILADGGLLTRAKLSEAAGFTAVSGTLTRVLNGLREGSSSGVAHPGLIALGYVERLELELDGDVTETCYQITDKGREALNQFLRKGDLPDLRQAASCTNRRYKGEVQ